MERSVIFDFAIMSLPRSGSHMLMSALHSHDDITMVGELRMREKFSLPASEGALRGCIVPSYTLPNPPGWVNSIPIIFILRDIEEIDRSPYHQHTAPVDRFDAIRPKSRMPYLERQLELMSRFMYNHKDIRLIVSYDEMCGGKDARVLKQSAEICRFLGVGEQPLRPLTYKPSSTSTVRHTGCSR